VSINPAILFREQAFFDSEYSHRHEVDLFIAGDQFERYQNARHHPLNIPKDTLFAELLPLEGKTVLDYGSGDGENAVLLASCGAKVTALDLSPKAIENGRDRASLHGLDDRIDFRVARAGSLALRSESFDIVFGSAILHHLHQDLDNVFAEIAALLKPGGRACFIEPVANSPFLRLARRLVPVPCYATPDERQLHQGDVALMREHFSSVDIRYYYCLERLERFFGEFGRNALRWVDHHMQKRAPFLQRFYGHALIVARK
jgi:ubiquinone/menaquinone biosynthesis C-methylase UbiE